MTDERMTATPVRSRDIEMALLLELYEHERCMASLDADMRIVTADSTHDESHGSNKLSYFSRSPSCR